MRNWEQLAANSRNVRKAFATLRKMGYFARQNWQCCQGCGWAAIPADKRGKAVFYHAQDERDKQEGLDFFLSWSGDARQICDVLNQHGVMTEWNNVPDLRIRIRQ